MQLQACDKKDAAFFYVEKIEGSPGEFFLLVRNTETGDKEHVTMQFNFLKRLFTGYGGRFLLAKGFAAKFEAYPTTKKNPLNIKTWVQKPCYIRILDESILWERYVAVNNSGIVKCVPEKELYEGHDYSTIFKFEQVGAEKVTSLLYPERIESSPCKSCGASHTVVKAPQRVNGTAQRGGVRNLIERFDPQAVQAKQQTQHEKDYKNFKESKIKKAMSVEEFPNGEYNYFYEFNDSDTIYEYEFS